MKGDEMHVVAGMVILYNSSQIVLHNIRSYILQVEKLYVIDNSDYVDEAIVEEIKRFNNVHYIYRNGNKGVADALNTGARHAIEDGFDYLLTMDDDSSIGPGYIQTLLDYYLVNTTKKIGIVSCKHSKSLRGEEYNGVAYTMTSGNLLNLNVYEAVGPFLNELFIDQVDHEYGLRLKANGYKVVEINSVTINHRLGELKVKKFIIWNIPYVYHSETRVYYLTRNSLFVISKYFKLFPGASFRILKSLLKEMIKIALFEKKNQSLVDAVFVGIWDAFRNRLGKK